MPAKEPYDIATGDIYTILSSNYKNYSPEFFMQVEDTYRQFFYGHQDELEVCEKWTAKNNEYIKQRYEQLETKKKGRSAESPFTDYFMPLSHIPAKKYAPLNILMTDYVENSILRDIWQNQVKCNTSVLRSILHSDFSPFFNPFEDYFYSLPAWDGTTDHIKELADTVKTDNQAFWEKAFRKWLVAMVASALDDNIVNHTVLVLSGPQGVGKTTWILRLLTEKLRKYVYSGTINPDNKDTLAHISECILINLDELENLNRSELGSLKDLITKMLIRIRRPYGHNNETYARRASFAGSVNNNQFLSDTTGSRRFLCFEIISINYQHSINMDLVFAQALYLSRNGFKYWFDKEEITEINEINEKHQIQTAEEELLLLYYLPDEKDSPEMSFTTSQVARRLEEMGGLKVNYATINTLGKALRKHNFPRIKKGGVYVYKMKMNANSPNTFDQKLLNVEL